ncbi:DUF4932 domain-containing protein [Capnocytophaga felis]|uniref:DUF4932 domain-containing protein n=1 Tax=Capnocytophaga felis TaxID=2267611 RepID=A0A5M4BBC1_9FLAO|nr:DUF4932 domain-containing protein [Capnocytophaga felis]GET46396.1 hypothetical protein RCZ01_16980 [Capnocytophaga felis]GET48285.1 hypothetical protein RCZ02_11160 [Capnocytophaga felis]
MRIFLTFVLIALSFNGFAQKIFKTDSKYVVITFDGIKTELELSVEASPLVLELECLENKNKGTLSDGKNTSEFTLKKGQKLYFDIHTTDKKIVRVQLVGIEPNVHFSNEYIKAHKGKNFVEIPEVSELVNILLVLHKDAEKDHNMFDTKTTYYQKVKKYFEPYRNHPALDIIHKNMQAPVFNSQQNVHIFPIPAYKYYYALKMNACAYEFDNQNRIKHKGTVQQIGKYWNDFDPMKDVAVFEDFARKSNFRKFYNDNKPYYNELLATFHRLSPVDKMQQWLDKKFGFGYDSYMIYFSPLNKGAQAATQFEKGDFKQTFMFICKTTEYEEHSPTLNELLSGWIVFTEIDHNYVNPLSDKNLQYINRVFSNRNKWAKGDVAQAYPDPYAVFNEYMTFGLYTLYAIDHYSQEDVMKFLPMYEPMMENVRGFIRFKDFNRALLERYQKNPDIDMNALFQYMMYWALQINDKE